MREKIRKYFCRECNFKDTVEISSKLVRFVRYFSDEFKTCSFEKNAFEFFSLINTVGYCFSFSRPLRILKPKKNFLELLK